MLMKGAPGNAINPVLTVKIKNSFAHTGMVDKKQIYAKLFFG